MSGLKTFYDGIKTGVTGIGDINVINKNEIHYKDFIENLDAKDAHIDDINQAIKDTAEGKYPSVSEAFRVIHGVYDNPDNRPAWYEGSPAWRDEAGVSNTGTMQLPVMDEATRDMFLHGVRNFITQNAADKAKDKTALNVSAMVAGATIAFNRMTPEQRQSMFNNLSKLANNPEVAAYVKGILDPEAVKESIEKGTDLTMNAAETIYNVEDKLNIDHTFKVEDGNLALNYNDEVFKYFESAMGQYHAPEGGWTGIAGDVHDSVENAMSNVAQTEKNTIALSYEHLEMEEKRLAAERAALEYRSSRLEYAQSLAKAKGFDLGLDSRTGLRGDALDLDARELPDVPTATASDNNMFGLDF